MTEIRNLDRIVLKVTGARGAIGLDLIGSPSPGQYVVFNADRRVQGVTAPGQDASVLTDLGASDGSGSALVSYSDVDGGPSISLRSKLRRTRTGDFARDMLSSPVADGAVLRPVSDILFSRGLSIDSFGAATTKSGPENLAALQKCLAACKQLKVPMLLPVGTFDLATSDAGPVIIDPTYLDGSDLKTVPILGLGSGLSVLRMSNPPVGGVALRFATTDEWYHPIFQGFSVTGNHAGVLLAMGHDDFRDALNILTMCDIAVLNSGNSDNNVALRLNYIAPGAVMIGITSNAYAIADAQGNILASKGTGLECRQVEDCTFYAGSASNAERGADFKDGYSFGCEFVGYTFENCVVCFSHRSAISGSHLIQCCQFSNVSGWAIQSTGCNSSQWIKFIANNFTPPGALVDPSACEGVWIEDRRNITTPPMGASGMAVRNTTGYPVSIMLWGGLVSKIQLDSLEIANPASGQLPITNITLNPGQSIALERDITQPTSWVWMNRGG